MTTDLTPAVADIQQLRTSFAGDILTPEYGPRYDAARSGFNAMFDRRPLAIAQATCDGDVVAAILFAQSARLPLAVRAGGHSVAGFSTIEDGLLLDLGPLRAIEVDPEARVARVGAGVTWGELDAATQAHGLATTGGRMTTTGVAGFVLGSGSGWLERTCGLACDNLVSARVVTADGRVVTASESENPELFWGLKGGGGNFGVVTEFELRLHPVGPTVYGGLLMYPRDQAVQVLANLRDVLSSSPRELTAGGILQTAPPAPFVPADLHGQPVVTVLAVWFGDPAAGPEALERLRSFGAPAVDTVAPIPYTALQAITDPGNPPGRRNYWHSSLLAEVPDAALVELVERGNQATSPASVLIFAPGGGAVADVAEGATAIGGRSAPWAYHCYGTWVDEPDTEHVAWVKGTKAAMEPWSTRGMALNFLTDVDEDRVRTAFGAPTYDRLVALKDRYDPSNLFCRNQNVPPSATAG